MDGMARLIVDCGDPILIRQRQSRQEPARCNVAAGFVIALMLSGVGHAETATYRLDPEHTTVAFLVSHIGFARVLGSFAKVEGSFRFDDITNELTDVSVVVQTTSVATLHEARDNHIRSDDFLASGDFPEMTFVAAAGRDTGQGTFEIAGELELLGQVRPLVLSARVNKSGDYPIGRNTYAMGVSATATVKRSDYGMRYALDNGWVGDEVEIIVEFEARRE